MTWEGAGNHNQHFYGTLTCMGSALGTLIKSSQQPCEENDSTIPTLQMGKLRQREHLDQDDTAGQSL